MNQSLTLPKIIYMLSIFAFLYAPILVLMALSFNSATYSIVWHGFSLKWYHALFQDVNIWIAAWHSIILGVLASIIATILGTLTAVSLFRFKFKGKKLLQGLIFVLIIIPDIVMGIALLILFSRTQIPLGFISLLLAHITFCLPFVIVTVFGRMTGIDKNIFEAAIDLGASEFTILRKITLPLLLPAIIAGMLLSFTLSFDDVVISYFVSGPGFEILPLKIFSLARLGLKPELNALCSIVFVTTIIMVISAQFVLKRKKYA